MAKVITISASAQHGKDTFAGILENLIKADGKNVMIFHYADILKFVAAKWYGWDGQKDEKGRTLLQHLGTNLFRKNRPDCWVNIVKELILGLGDTVDFVLIPDCRFPNEILALRPEIKDVISIKVVRPNFDNGLTEEQKRHPSETALNNWKFDKVIYNEGTLEDFKNSAKAFYEEIK